MLNFEPRLGTQCWSWGHSFYKLEFSIFGDPYIGGPDFFKFTFFTKYTGFCLHIGISGAVVIKKNILEQFLLDISMLNVEPRLRP